MGNFFNNVKSNLSIIREFIKEKKERIIGIILIIGFPTFIFYNIHNDKKKYNLFFSNRINSKVIEIQSHWSGNKNRFITEENISITLPFKKKLLIGDSISKRNNTDSFEVFRLNSLDSNYYLVEFN